MVRYGWMSLWMLGALAFPSAHAQPHGAVLPAGLDVELHLQTDIDTRRTRTGDSLVFTVMGSDCTGGVRVRGGSEITGRVVHAQKAGIFGKAAELLLSADPWTPAQGAGPVRFRNLRAMAGRNRNAAALGVSVVAGPFAAFVRGGHIVMPAGTPMVAQTRDAVELPAAAFETCDATSPMDGASPSPAQPPVHPEPPQGELHEANDAHPVDPEPRPEPEPRDGAGAARH